MPPTDAFHLQHWYSVRAHAEIGLYRGALGPIANWRRTLGELSRSLLVRIQTVRSEAVWLSGRLLCAQAAAGIYVRRSLAEANACARRLERERVAYASVWGHLLRAVVTEDADARVAELRHAVKAAEANDQHLCAAAARVRLAELVAGDEGIALRAQAGTWMAGEGIRNPQRLIEVMAPSARKK